jgi:hypothetical protein
MQAVDAWLKGDGLTITDMDSRKAMAQRVVGFLVGTHWVPLCARRAPVSTLHNCLLLPVHAAGM